ncbi:MAG: hypothetical protein DI551_10170 [Micavibrio aeruginosavorus]|uniref:phosphoglycolate phosphatase n=1 Tax=Micavibrio aeruginosavorus TaxID=349221 RepID=A0A2W5N0J2_9BACT|nr:MAG: hypothetical protein DI551_10170 [Micavibrio aeruginosavorus]
MKSTRQLFVFNLIGTVFDAKGIYVRAFADACEAHGLNPAMHINEVKAAIGNKRLKEMVSDLFPDMTDEEFKEFQTTCNRIRDDLLVSDCQPFPHVFDAVNYLQSIDHVTALVTGTAGEAVKLLSDKYSLASLFGETNIHSRDLEKDAALNNVQLRERQLSDLQWQHKGLWLSLIGDSVADCVAAYPMYYEFWAFLHDSSDAQELRERTEPDRNFYDYAEFIDRIKGYETTTSLRCNPN